VRNVAFIRNVMVGRAVRTQPVLREAFDRFGGRDVVSALATGNIVSSSDDAMNVATNASGRLRSRHGLDEPVVVCALDFLRAVAAGNPFSVAPDEDSYCQCMPCATKPRSLVGAFPSNRRSTICVYFGSSDHRIIGSSELRHPVSPE